MLIHSIDTDSKILVRGISVMGFLIRESGNFDKLNNFDKIFIENLCKGDLTDDFSSEVYIKGIVFMMNGILEKIGWIL